MLAFLSPLRRFWKKMVRKNVGHVDRQRKNRFSYQPSLLQLEDRVVPATLADSLGTDFWLTFTENLGTPELTLFLTGETNTTGTVDIPALAFSTPFSVTAGTVTSVVLPSGAVLSSSDVVDDKGIHVTAQNEISVYGLNRITFTTDAYLGLPTDILGTEYIVLTAKNVDIVEGTEFAIVGTVDGTTVSITPSVTTGAHTAGVAYTINLNQGDTYQLQNTNSFPADLSGTIITADQPIAVFGGHICANIPDGGTFFCDHVEEELPATATWGKNFVTMPLATRLNGDFFRMVASTDATDVLINGVLVATLNRGQVHEQQVVGPSQITSTNPILVAQFSNGTTYDNVTSDPFMMLIPPSEQFLGAYTVTTPATGFATNFINVVAPNAAVGSIILDGAAIPAGSFVAIGTSGFSGAQLSVALGSHRLTGPQAFGVFVYGFDSFDSYGYPGGLSLAPVASVTSLALTPVTDARSVGSPETLTATVLDQNNSPLQGVRVDFVVTGVNPTASFAFTDASGQAQFSYVGANPGVDTVTASIGTLADSSQITWTVGGQRVAPTLTVIGGVFIFDGTTKLATASATGVNGEDLGPVTITYIGSTPLPTNDETYRVIATFGGDANYLPATAETTLTIVPPKAVLRARYWKTHLAAWPVSALDIGGISYSQAELVTVLGSEGGAGDARLGLMRAVIVAKLGAALGVTSPALQALIAQADDLFASLGQKVVPGSDPLDPASDLGLQMIALQSQFVQHKLNLII